MISLQQYADNVVDEKYKQPLLTAEEACNRVGWEFVDFPVCCGETVKTLSFLGDCYSARCEKCGRFVVDVTGPAWTGGAAVCFPDSDQVDVKSDYAHRWIAGIRQEAP